MWEWSDGRRNENRLMEMAGSGYISLSGHMYLLIWLWLFD